MHTLYLDSKRQMTVQYKLTHSSMGVCVSCTFLDNSTTGCVAVVHQRISQLSSSGLMNIVSSHKLNRYGDSAYGCIDGVDLTESSIGVIGATFIISPQTNHDSGRYMAYTKVYLR